MTAKALLQAAGDGTAVPAGYVGQVIASSTTSGSLAASGNYTSVSSIVLPTPGNYSIFSGFNVNRGVASFSATQFVYGVSAVNDNGGTGFVYGVNAGYLLNVVPTSFTQVALPIPPFMVKYDGTTITKFDDNVAFASGSTLYLKFYADTYSGTITWSGKLVAIRIA